MLRRFAVRFLLSFLLLAGAHVARAQDVPTPELTLTASDSTRVQRAIPLDAEATANESCTDEPLEPGIQFQWGGRVRENDDDGSTDVRAEVSIEGQAEFVPGTEGADRGTWTTFTKQEGVLDIGTTEGGEVIDFWFDVKSLGEGTATYTFEAFDEGGKRGEVVCDFIFEEESPASLSGTKWNDANGNGQRDDGEEGLEGWTIELDTGASTQTDASGAYSFTDLEPGEYTVSEVQQDGWTQTFPDGSYTVTLESGEAREGLNFGNRQEGSLVVEKAEGFLFLSTSSFSVPRRWNVNFVIKVENGSVEEARNVIIEDELPTGFELQRTSEECEVTGIAVRCEIGNLAPGETSDAVSIKTRPQEVGEFVNTAKAVSDNVSSDDDSIEITVYDPSENTEGRAEPEEQTVDQGDEGTIEYTITNTSDNKLWVPLTFDLGEEVNLLDASTSDGECVENDDGEKNNDGETVCAADVEGGNSFTVTIRFKAVTVGTFTIPAFISEFKAAEAEVTAKERDLAQTNGNTTTDGTDGDPVSTFTGELFSMEAPDLALGGPLPVRFQRYYGSFLERDGRVESALGPGWAHPFDWRLIEINAQVVEAVSWRGRVVRFEEEEGTWMQASLPERPYQLVEETEGYRLANPRAQRIYTFDADGNLTKIGDGRGNQLTLTYDGSGQLTEVSDGLGRSLTFTYDGDRLASVSDGTRTVQFGYAGGLLTGATDPLGNTTTYSYDGDSAFAGLLTEKTRPGGNTVLTQTYDGEGRVDTQTDALGNTTTFAYSVDEETGERTTTVTDPMGNTSEHVHNADGQLLSATDASGQTIDLGYSDGGQRDQITDRLGDDTEYVFDQSSRLPTTVTDARGGVTTYSYTTRSDDGFDFQELTGTGHPDGTSVSYSYDADGNLTSMTGPAGNTRTLTYNGRGQPLTVTNPEGGTTTYGYNGDGTLASVEDPAGNTTTFGYDALRRPVSITHPDGTSRTFSYDDADRITEMTDEEGRTYNFSYDANGNLTSITDPSGQAVQRSYDAMDRLTGVTDRTGQSISYSYDAQGRLQSITDRAGNTTTLGYDAEDRLTSITNGAGETSTIRYDAEGVPTALTNPNGETTTLTSNAMGWITQITSPLGNSVSRNYDAMGRVTSVQDPSGGTTQLNRDARGLLDGMTLPGGASASYSRDGMGFLEGRTGPNGGNWQTPRDAQGRQTRQTDPLGQSADNTHDSRNRIVNVGQPGGLGTVTRSYDGTNNLTGLAHSGGPNLSYSYDTNGRLTGATGVDLSRDAEGRITESNGLGVTRDSEGRIASVTLPGGTVQYRYDGAGRVTEVEDWQGGVTSFSYDGAGRLTQITRPNGTTTSYSYDADGRIVEIEETDGEGTVLASSVLSRDERGNVTEAERSGPVAPELSPETESYSYDAAGQMESFSYDALGRLTDDGTRTYTWDGLSRLESVSNGTETTDFTYDAFGNRLSKSEGGTEHTFVWNYALDLPSVAVEKENGTDQRYYVHAPNGMLLYSVEAGGGSRRFYHFDEMGNTTLLTGEEGAVEAAYAYSPYGTVVGESGDVETPFTWQGEFGVMAEGNGLYYVRARYYDASTRRFLSRDPVRSLRPDEIAPYQYARANPRRFVDPEGQQSTVVVYNASQGEFHTEHRSSPATGQENDNLDAVAFDVDPVIPGPENRFHLPRRTGFSVTFPDDVDVDVEPVIFDPGPHRTSYSVTLASGQGDNNGSTDQATAQGGCTPAPRIPDRDFRQVVNEALQIVGGDVPPPREAPDDKPPASRIPDRDFRQVVNEALRIVGGDNVPPRREVPGDKHPGIMTDHPQKLVIC